MKTLVVYDSAYGNTERIARAIADGLPEAELKPVGQVVASDPPAADLLIVGSPTQGGRPTPAVKQLLESLPATALRDTRVAAFDTRFDPKTSGFGLKVLMRIIGFAAPRIAAVLQAKGGDLSAPPQGFIVERKEGPLREGEIERAKAWAEGLR